MSNKWKFVTYVTPKSEIVFSHLAKPSTKFGDKPVFNVTFALEGEDAEKFDAKLKELAEAAREHIVDEDKKAAKYDLYVPGKDEVLNEKPTGRRLYTIKLNATKKDGDKIVRVEVPIFDSQKKRIPCPMIGRGTFAKIAFYVVPFKRPPVKVGTNGDVGASLRLSGVQIINLVKWEGGVSSAFDNEEGGFVAEEGGEPESSASSSEKNEDFE